MAAVVGASLVLPGCSMWLVRDPVFLAPGAWAEAVRSKGVDPMNVPNPVESGPELEAFAREVAGSGSMFERLTRLQNALFDRSLFTIDQEARETLTAVEAFRARRGNCVSFTNLFLALARSLGIQLQAGLVHQRESSERKEDLVLVYTHMVAVVRFVKGFAIYDFYAASERRGAEIRLVDDIVLTGILQSNRGVSALRSRDYPLALARFNDAVRLAPQFTGAWGNLGLVQWKLGAPREALESFRRALAIDSREPTVLHNLAALYLSEGNEASARAALAAADSSTVSAHTLIVRGDLDLSAGNVKGALRSYRQARSVAPKSTDPLVAISRAEMIRGNRDAAREALEKAARLAPGDAVIQKLLESL